MRLDGDLAMIALDARRSLRVERGARVRITCATGVVWITQEGDVRDLFLGSGDVLLLSPRGVAFVTALEPSLLRVEDRRSLSRFASGIARAAQWLGGWASRRFAGVSPAVAAGLVLRR